MIAVLETDLFQSTSYRLQSSRRKAERVTMSSKGSDLEGNSYSGNTFKRSDLTFIRVLGRDYGTVRPWFVGVQIP
jgi:hypothetical protein